MIRQGQRPRIFALALLFGLALSGLAGGAALADDFANCNQQKDLDLRVRGCTALMQSGLLPAGDKAVVLQLRGNALRAKREFDRALADYNEAMALADDDTVRRSIETGIMMALTQGPPELRSTPNGKRAIALLEKNFQRSKAARPAPK